MTMRKLKSQFEQVENALALARVLTGEISAGYNQGKGSHVAPKAAMYKKRPTTAPLAFLACVSSERPVWIIHANVMIIAPH